MRLTRCPACATYFRVSDAQLDARQGKVRCGKCATVFNALDTLIDPAAMAKRSATPFSEPDFARKAPDLDAPGKDDFAAEAPAASAAAHTESESALRLDDASHEDDDLLLDAETEELQEEEERDEQPALVGPEEGLVEPAPTRQRIVPWLWAIAVLLMLGLLGLQAAYWFRGELALQYPEFRPQLAQLCAALDCDIPLPHRAELVSIETSDLHPDPQHKNRLLLLATLKNRAGFAQRYPYLELTLTDMRDQPIARRVFEPRSYLQPGGDLDRGFAANSEATINLAFDIVDLEPSGYRVYVFYP